MNVLPMPPGVHSVPHIHEKIKTIAYLLEGEYTLFHGDDLDKLISMPELSAGLEKQKSL